jgi:hypothetical protein
VAMTLAVWNVNLKLVAIEKKYQTYAFASIVIQIHMR